MRGWAVLLRAAATATVRARPPRACLALALLAPLAGTQEEDPGGLEESALEIAERVALDEPPLAEGALQTDVFLPSVEPAGVLLARGDASLARARRLAQEAAPADVERAATAAFDDWFAALAEAGPGGSVRPDPPPEGPLTEGASQAVLRRLAGLAPDELALWRARFEPAAAAALAGAGSAGEGLGARLLEVERSFPGTAGAARAALALADLALERGASARARALLERARRHAERGALPELEDALAARAALLPPEPATPAGSEAWERADGLALAGRLPLEDPRQEPASERDLLPQRGVRPGLAWLAGRRVLVQSAEALHLIALGDAGPRLVRRVEPADLLGAGLGLWETPRAPRSAPGWGLSPDSTASTGSTGTAGAERVVLVAGRAVVPPDPEQELEPNALVCVEVAAEGLSLAWAVSGGTRLGPDGEPLAEVRGPGAPALELQPAPRIAGSLVLVCGREVGADERAWLCAFELATGELAWRRLLAQGSDLSFSTGRFGGGPGPRLPAPAPLLLGTRVFAATTLGAGVLLELPDGRPLWSLGIRRRLAGDDGWSGVGPLALAAVDGARGVLWDPVDSDVLYRLRAEPLEGPAPRRADLFLEPPRRLGEAEHLVGGERGETIVFARSGSARSVDRWRGPSADPESALHLAARERFRGRGLVGAERVLACTERGVHLFDRGRGLYLLDLVPLAAPAPRGDEAPGPPGGDLWARGADVLVLGRTELWSLVVR